MDGKIFLTPEDLVQRWEGKITLRTLANWRSGREGPKPTKIGGKVLYRLDVVEAWEQQRTQRRTG
jgi:hypothetical protein